MKGVPFVNNNIEGIRKGYLFREKWYVKGKGLDLGGPPPPGSFPLVITTSRPPRAFPLEMGGVRKGKVPQQGGYDEWQH